MDTFVADYWWLILAPLLVLVVLMPLGSAAFESRAVRTRHAGPGGELDTASPDLAVDLAWLGILLGAFIVLAYFRP